MLLGSFILACVEMLWGAMTESVCLTIAGGVMALISGFALILD